MESKKNIATIKDVARLANVSISTVSRVLNETVPVSEELCKKVRDAANSVDYKPNAMARSLISKKTMTIAVIIPNLSNQFFPEILSGISGVVDENGYFLIICNTDYNEKKEENYINEMLERRVDGFIIISSSIGKEKLSELLENKSKVVFVNSYASFGYNIVEDGIKPTFTATEYLINRGHIKIACLGWTFKGIEVRYQGFLKALEKHKIKMNPNYIIECGYSKKEIHDNTIKLLSREDRPTAIVAFNDDTAIGIMSAAKAIGISIPEELSIIGYDNIFVSSVLSTPLTTIEVNIYDTGKLAGKKIIERIIGYGEDIYEEHILDFNIIERKSVISI